MEAAMTFGDTRFRRFVKGLGAAVGAAALLAVTPVAAHASVSPFFEATGSMVQSRSDATAAPLPGGKALVAGGFRYSGPKDKFGSATSTAEVYDSATGEFAATGSMGTARMAPAAAPLPGGDVLVTGGHNSGGTVFSSTEIYDPETGEFSAGPALGVARTSHVAVPLPGGDVLIAGGQKNFAGGTGGLLGAEIYDPETGEFTATGSISTVRLSPAGVALPDGTVLIAGGVNPTSGYLASAEIYDPSTGEFSATGSMTAAMLGQGAALPDGTAVVFGQKEPALKERLIEEYDPATGTFSASPAAAPTVNGPAVTTLPEAKLLVAGGASENSKAWEGHAVVPFAEVFVSAPSATSPGVDFGAVEVATPSAVETLTVTNDGAQALEFESAASLSGPNAADFTIVADGCETAVLAFGESCAVEVQVEPSAPGVRSASVQLPNNSATGLQEFALEAEGI
jgi:Kelch motif protein